MEIIGKNYKALLILITVNIKFDFILLKNSIAIDISLGILFHEKRLYLFMNYVVRVIFSVASARSYDTILNKILINIPLFVAYQMVRVNKKYIYL